MPDKCWALVCVTLHCGMLQASLITLHTVGLSLCRCTAARLCFHTSQRCQRLTLQWSAHSSNHSMSVHAVVKTPPLSAHTAEPVCIASNSIILEALCRQFEEVMQALHIHSKEIIARSVNCNCAGWQLRRWQG